MGFGEKVKAVSVVLFVLSFFGSVVLGLKCGDVGSYSLEISWTVFLCGIIPGLIFCFFIYILGEIIDQLEISNNNIYELCRLIEKMFPKVKIKANLKKNIYLLRHRLSE